MKTYEELIGRHIGEYAFVLGAGQSLYNLWTSFHRKEVFNQVVISINSSIILCPWDTPDNGKRYWISNDALCRRWTWWDKVEKSNATKVVRNSWLKYKDDIPGFLFFEPRPTSEGVINTEDRGLAYCSSAPSGIDLAIQMGCSKIFLIGVDQHNKGGHSHFWELMPKKYHPRQLKPAQGPYNQQKKVFPFNDMAYQALRGFAEGRGVGIYNCSDSTCVKAFELMTLDDAVELCSGKQ